MNNLFVCYFKGKWYWHIGRMTSYFVSTFVKRNQRKMSLVDKWNFGFVGKTRFSIYDYICLWK